MSGDTQKALRRKPDRARVELSYDVQVGEGIERREIPFLVGVMADLSGNAGAPLPRLSDRKFTEIDRDNFDRVFAGVGAGVSMTVPNRLADDGTDLPVSLRFDSMDSLRPESIVEQVPALRELMDIRRRLYDLSVRAQHEKIEELVDRVKEILKDDSVRSALEKAQEESSAGSGEEA